MIKKTKFLLIIAFFIASCADDKKNPLLIPPDYDKIVKEENTEQNNSEDLQDLKKLQLNLLSLTLIHLVLM